jgi:hypothetical protein
MMGNDGRADLQGGATVQVPTRRLRADIILADGVPAGYQAARAADLLAARQAG